MFEAWFDSAPIAWIVLAVVLALIEAFTLGLVTIWFAGGAVIAAISALFTDKVWIQVAVFVVASATLLYFTRPILVGKFKIGTEKTNIDAIIGKEAIVTRTIEPFKTGEAKISGQYWSAVSAENRSVIENGTRVTVKSIEGVKLIVEPSESTSE